MAAENKPPLFQINTLADLQAAYREAEKSDVIIRVNPNISDDERTLIRSSLEEKNCGIIERWEGWKSIAYGIGFTAIAVVGILGQEEPFSIATCSENIQAAVKFFNNLEQIWTATTEAINGLYQMRNRVRRKSMCGLITRMPDAGEGASGSDRD